VQDHVEFGLILVGCEAGIPASGCEELVVHLLGIEAE
jgi:hypothetical protein